MIVKFLGTGTSQGIPVIACHCKVCTSDDFRDKRLRTSVHISIEDKSFVIDTGPDFRQQMLREQIETVDAIIFTHEHRDHIAGLDDVRSYNFKQQKDMPVYGNARVMDQLKKEFHYVFNNNYPGIPQLELHEIKNEVFEVKGIRFQPIKVMHHKLAVFGFRIKNFTYITDANYIPKKEFDKIIGTEVLVINALQRRNHISHFNLNEALSVIEDVHPKKAYLTHLSHNMGLHREVSKELPASVNVAYDGLKIEI